MRSIAAGCSLQAGSLSTRGEGRLRSCRVPPRGCAARTGPSRAGCALTPLPLTAENLPLAAKELSDRLPSLSVLYNCNRFKLNRLQFMISGPFGPLRAVYRFVLQLGKGGADDGGC